MGKYTLIDRLLLRRKTPKRQTLKSIPMGFATLRVANSADSYLQGLLEITKDGKINDATAKTMANIGKELMKKYTKKFANTGDLSNSFFVKKERIFRGEAVYSVQSNQPYAAVWTHPGDEAGDQGLGNVDKMKAWMQGKTFVDPHKWSKAGKSRAKKRKGSHLGTNPTKEQIEASALFLLSRSIREARNNNPSKKSRLRKISTGGNRTYDYPMLVRDAMIPELEAVKIRILEGLV
jgi:hypothetical protein